MRARRPLAGLAAVCLAATAILALTAHSGRSAVSATLVPLTMTPSCAAVSTQVTVRLQAKGMTPGPNEVKLNDQGAGHNETVSLPPVTVGANGVLDTTMTMPAQPYAGLFRISIGQNLLFALGYFSVPCPTISVQPTCGPADDGSGARYALTVTGTGYGAPPPLNGTRSEPGTPFFFTTLPVHVESEGGEFPGSPATVNADGTFSVLLTPGRARAGVHQVHAYVTTGDATDNRASRPVVSFRDAYVPFTAPCPTTPTTPTQTTTPTKTATSTPTTAPTTAPTTPTTAPATKTTQTKTTQTVTTPTTPVTIAIAPTCLEPSATATARVQVTGSDLTPGPVDVLLDGDIATKAAADKDGKVAAEVELTPGTADHAIELRQGSRQADATLRVPCASHPKLQVDPSLGPPGSVTKASGSGFPPNVDVQLAWQPGIGTWTVHTDAEGTFDSQVLVFPQDVSGERVLRATPVSKGRFAAVDAKFLCVPGSVQQPRTFEVRR